jgi:RimJ/RimL family protein N-acetyltransferase
LAEHNIRHTAKLELDLLERHLDGLYQWDSQRRIVAINQFDGGRVPRFHLARGRCGKLAGFRADLSDDLIRSLKTLVEQESDGLARSPEKRSEYLALLAADEPIVEIWQGPVYALPEHLPDVSDIVDIDTTNKRLLQERMADWLPDVAHRRPFVAALEDGQAVAVCASVRITDQGHEAGVETVPAYRRRGHARRVVAAWAQRVRALDAEPVYSTSFENTASQRVAMSLGMKLIGVDFHVR